jgi:hypothetical protein
MESVLQRVLFESAVLILVSHGSGVRASTAPYGVCIGMHFGDLVVEDPH